MSLFEESKMIFDIPDENLFRIEHSNFYSKMKGVSSVEFLCFLNSKLCWVEAKSSFPRAENKEDFIKNIEDIATKFIHSFELYLSNFVGANKLISSETPKAFLSYDFSHKLPLKFVLIINCYKIEKANIPIMISTIQDSFLKKFQGHKSIWNIDFIVIDHETAIKYNLVKKLAI